MKQSSYLLTTNKILLVYYVHVLTCVIDDLLQLCSVHYLVTPFPYTMTLTKKSIHITMWYTLPFLGFVFGQKTYICPNTKLVFAILVSIYDLYMYTVSLYIHGWVTQVMH